MHPINHCLFNKKHVEKSKMGDNHQRENKATCEKT